MTSAELRFFRSYVREWAESLFLSHFIGSRQCEELQALCDEPEGRVCAEQLFSRGIARIPKFRLVLQLKKLREMDGGHFYHVEVRKERRRSRKACFVGHRFIPSIERTLRWNLAQVLEPYNVHLDWSGQDPQSVQLFEDIVRRIKRADFCIFDNRATNGKPNVYIEAGIAYAAKVPFILFEFAPAGGKKPNPPIPSDLDHALAFRYRSYQELFRKLYFSLPVFFRHRFR